MFDSFIMDQDAINQAQLDLHDITQAVKAALPGLDFRSNTTSTRAIRVSATRAPGAGRDDKVSAAHNDDIAQALKVAGFYVARRGAGQAVYAHSGTSSHASGITNCQMDTHAGDPAPWIAVLPQRDYTAPYACHACVKAHTAA